jgi:hypothetical protein
VHVHGEAEDEAEQGDEDTDHEQRPAADAAKELRAVKIRQNEVGLASPMVLLRHGGRGAEQQQRHREKWKDGERHPDK